MGMGRQLAKGMGYAAAPKATFAALNPGKAAVAKAASWTMDRMIPSRRRHSRSRTAMKGFGAAALALPVGIWLGRRLWSSRAGSEAGGQGMY